MTKEHPTVGRIVHLHDHGLPPGGYGEQGTGPYAAIVTAVRPATKADKEAGTTAQAETIDVMAFFPAHGVPTERGGVPFLPAPVAPDEAPEFQRYWTWPARA